jgi:DNA-binding response OmpR family regulator
MDERPILVVDDDAEMRALLGEVLRPEGFLVEEAANGAEALARLRSKSFAAIIIDKNRSGLAGLHLLPSLRAISRDTPVVLLTTLADAIYLDGLSGGLCEVIFKPFRMEELLLVVRRSLLAEDRSASPHRVAGATP